MEIQFKEIQFENVTNFSLSYSTMVSTIKKYGEEILSTVGKIHNSIHSLHIN